MTANDVPQPARPARFRPGTPPPATSSTSARALQDRFPTYYEYFGVRSFTYRGVRHRNHNRLLGSVEGVDGIKTGYIRASGFNLVTNVKRDGRHIIAVVMGGKTAASRDAQMRELIAEYLPAAKRGRRTDAAGGRRCRRRKRRTRSSCGGVEMRTPRARAGDRRVARLTRAHPATDTVTLRAGRGARPVMATRPMAATPADQIADRISRRATCAFAHADAEVVPDPIAPAIETRATRGRRARRCRHRRPTADRSRRRPQLGQRIAPAARISSPAAAPARRGDRGRRRRAGWHIQIGAVPTDGRRPGAARKRAGLHGSACSLRCIPLTQPVERNGTTLYRARFAGFSDKEQARATCAKLKSKSFACLAVPN